MGEGLLAKFMGKKRLIAETGAGQHGVALATAAAFFVPRLGLSSLPLSISAKRCLSVRVSVTPIVVANCFSSGNYTSSYDKPIISSIIASTSIFLRVTDAL